MITCFAIENYLHFIYSLIITYILYIYSVIGIDGNSTEWTINNTVHIPWPPDDIKSPVNKTEGWEDPSNDTEQLLWILNDTAKVDPKYADEKSARLYVPKAPPTPHHPDKTENDTDSEGHKQKQKSAVRSTEWFGVARSSFL